MRLFVTGVGGQLGYDVVNEAAFRGYEAVGSDLAPAYSGIADGTAVTKAPYISLDIHRRRPGLSRCHRPLCGLDRRGRCRRGGKPRESHRYQRRRHPQFGTGGKGG